MAAHPQSHRSDPRILGRRTLERDHRHLAQLLRPGLSVLDVGCGIGAITSGIARAVAPGGYVVGLDRDAGLLALARREHGAVPNLHFVNGDAGNLAFRAPFDIVTAARTLQWIADPGRAISKMKEAARPSGILVILDYNHASNRWQPDPPREFRTFYEAFLAWREANHWDNAMADHLPQLFRSAGITSVENHNQDEVVERGDPDFDARKALWCEVIESIGEPLAKAGFLTAGQLEEARQRYQSWTRTDLIRQTLVMRTVVGTVPSN